MISSHTRQLCSMLTQTPNPLLLVKAHTKRKHAHTGGLASRLSMISIGSGGAGGSTVWAGRFFCITLHAFTHTRTHTGTFTHFNTQTHACAHTSTRTHTHTYKHTYTRTHTCTHNHTRTHTRTHSLTRQREAQHQSH